MIIWNRANHAFLSLSSAPMSSFHTKFNDISLLHQRWGKVFCDPFFRPAHMQSRLYKSLKRAFLSAGDSNQGPSEIKAIINISLFVIAIKPFCLFSPEIFRQLIKFPCPCLAVISLISAFKGALRRPPCQVTSRETAKLCFPFALYRSPPLFITIHFPSAIWCQHYAWLMWRDRAISWDT